MAYVQVYIPVISFDHECYMHLIGCGLLDIYTQGLRTQGPRVHGHIR